MRLFSVVRLKNSGEKLVVRSDWIFGMNSARTSRYGCRSTRQLLIFYSPTSIDEANFALPVNTEYDATKITCYMGYVLKTFGECEL